MGGLRSRWEGRRFTDAERFLAYKRILEERSFLEIADELNCSLQFLYRLFVPWFRAEFALGLAGIGFVPRLGCRSRLSAGSRGDAWRGVGFSHGYTATIVCIAAGFAVGPVLYGVVATSLGRLLAPLAAAAPAVLAAVLSVAPPVRRRGGA